jgi:hypothetical protein
MPIDGGRGDIGGLGGFGQGKASRALFGDQQKCRFDQGLAQVAVVIAALHPFGRSVVSPQILLSISPMQLWSLPS